MGSRSANHITCFYYAGKEEANMKCLKKFNWVKILRDELPYHAKGILIYFLRLVSRAAFRKGFACYCGYRNAVEVGSWVWWYRWPQKYFGG